MRLKQALENLLEIVLQRKIMALGFGVHRSQPLLFLPMLPNWLSRRPAPQGARANMLPQVCLGQEAPALQVGGLVAMGHTFMLYLATSLRVIPFPWKWPPMDLMEPIVQVVNRVERAVNFRALGIQEPQEKLQSSN